jgi:EmrB/QacA subfamily drug resistance transporter
MTDSAERTVDAGTLAAATADPIATDPGLAEPIAAKLIPSDTVVPELDSHNEIVDVLGRQLQYKYVVAIVYVTALFLDILDTTIVNVAIPKLGEVFHSGKAEWVVLGYTVSLAVWIPASGWLGDRFGTKKIFLFALTAFTMGSLLCSLSQSMGQLILFRVLQGVGGGMLTPVGIAMLYRAFPPAERAKAAMIVMIPALCAPAAGPVLGGLLVTHASWHWIFLINVPIGIVAFFFGWKNLRDHKEKSVGSFDLPGFLLSAGALSLIVFALSDGPEAGWASPPVLITAAVGAVCAFAMVYAELHIRYPMLDLRLLIHNRLFRMCNIVGLISMASFLGLTFVMPLYLQLLRGQNALTSGLTTFPQAFGIMISSLVAGRIYRKIGPRRLMAGGLFAAGLTIATFTRIGLDTSLWTIRILMFLRGLCMGYAFVPMQAASYATIKPADTGRASSIFSTQRQIGVSLGVAILASILTAHMALDRLPRPDEVNRALTGFHWAFGAAVGFAFLAAFAALFIRDSEAEGTMHPKRT